MNIIWNDGMACICSDFTYGITFVNAALSVSIFFIFNLASVETVKPSRRILWIVNVLYVCVLSVACSSTDGVNECTPCLFKITKSQGETDTNGCLEKLYSLVGSSVLQLSAVIQVFYIIMW